MNWQRGLLRVWLVAALCWVATTTWLAYAEMNTPVLSLFADLIPEGKSKMVVLGWSNEWFIRAYAAWVFLPPLALLAAGVMALWAVAGFRRDREAA